MTKWRLVAASVMFRLLGELNFLVKVIYFDLGRLAIKVGSDIALQLQPVLEPTSLEYEFQTKRETLVK